MAESRFASSDEIVVDQLQLNAKNKNTTKSTQTQLNVCEKWANERKLNPKLEEDEHADLDNMFQMFYAGVRTKDAFFYNRKCDNLIVCVVVLQRTASNCFNVRARPIKFLICGVS